MKPYLFSDLIDEVPKPELIGRWEQFLGDFLRPDVTRFVQAALYVDEPVVPGQPIPITITFSPVDRSLVGNGCHIDIFLEDAVLADPRIFQTPDDGTHQAYVGATSPFDILEMHVLIPPPPPLSLLGRHLYAFGDHTLRLELTTNGQARGPFESVAILTVVPEQVSSDWWKWQNMGLSASRWKEPYAIAGWCENRSQYSAMTFDLSLDETDETSALKEYAPLTALVDARAPTDSARESDLQSVQIVQDWAWLVQGVWAPKGPVGKEFSYRMKFTLHDVWGNDYPSELSRQATVVVNVSDTKLGLAQLAFSSNASAIALGIAAAALSEIPWLGLVLGTAATAAGIVAAVAGDKALDPPAPNPRYREEVQPVKFVLPGEWQRDEDRGLEDVRTFFEMTGQFLNDLAALGEIHSRLLGARRDDDHDGAAFQTGTYHRLLDKMTERVSVLQASADSAARAIHRTGAFQSEQFKDLVGGKRAKQWANLPREFEKRHLPKPVIILTREWLLQSQSARQQLSTVSIDEMFRMIGISVASIVVSIQRSADTLLRPS
jgi:hypothetical protein